MKIQPGTKLQKSQDGYTEKGYRVILRNVEKPVYPIDIFAAAEILQNLAKVILEGRLNGQHTAAEALGFLLFFSCKLGLTLMLQKVLYKNCDCQVTIRKKIWSCI